MTGTLKDGDAEAHQPILRNMVDILDVHRLRAFGLLSATGADCILCSPLWEGFCFPPTARSLILKAILCVCIQITPRLASTFASLVCFTQAKPDILIDRM
jgi:hypothetical protein